MTTLHSSANITLQDTSHNPSPNIYYLITYYSLLIRKATMHLTLYPALAALQIAASSPRRALLAIMGRRPCPYYARASSAGHQQQDHASHWSRIRAWHSMSCARRGLGKRRWGGDGKERAGLRPRSGRCSGTGAATASEHAGCPTGRTGRF